MECIHSNEEEYDLLMEICSNLERLYIFEYKRIKPYVYKIIDNNICDIQYIEKVLDCLLNVPYEPCYQLFIMLCNYVFKIDKEMALEYIELWDDLYGEDDDKIKNDNRR